VRSKLGLLLEEHKPKGRSSVQKSVRGGEADDPAPDDDEVDPRVHAHAKGDGGAD